VEQSRAALEAWVRRSSSPSIMNTPGPAPCGRMVPVRLSGASTLRGAWSIHKEKRRLARPERRAHKLGPSRARHTSHGPRLTTRRNDTDRNQSAPTDTPPWGVNQKRSSPPSERSNSSGGFSRVMLNSGSNCGSAQIVRSRHRGWARNLFCPWPTGCFAVEAHGLPWPRHHGAGSANAPRTMYLDEYTFTRQFAGHQIPRPCCSSAA